MSAPAISERPHGTRARYVQGCRCDDCRAANTAAYHERKRRSREIVGAGNVTPGEVCPGIDGEPCPHGTKLRADSLRVCGRCRDRLAWNGLVSATPARRHLRNLARAGVGYRQAADAAGVAASVVAKIRSGERRRIRKHTADRLLEVDAGAAADHAVVDGAETRRMLRELEPEFLTKGRLARALGYQTDALQIGRGRVLARTEARVRKLYVRTFPDRTAEITP